MFNPEIVKQVMIDEEAVVNIESREDFEQFCNIIDQAGEMLNHPDLHMFSHETDLSYYSQFAFSETDVCGVRRRASAMSFLGFLSIIELPEENSDLDLGGLL